MTCAATTAFAQKSTASAVGVSYSAHVQDIGWQSAVADGATAGTTGQSKRVEALTINLTNAPAGASIAYQVHVQDIGWQSTVADGATAGTTGQSKRVEAIAIALVGMPGYSVEYRVHVQDIGWMAWTKDGSITGTTGRSLRIEAIEIKIVSVPVSAITVTGTNDATTVVNGSTLQMIASVTPIDAPNKTITWTVATLSDGTATIDATTGVLTGTGVGTVTVTATNAASGVTGTKVITVTINEMDAANAAVVTAEGSNLQADVDAAQALVTALPDGAAKTALQGRINAVQVIVTLAAAKVTAHGVLTTALGTYTAGNYTTGNWATLNGFKTAGDTAINSATDLAGVTSAQNTATAGMAGVQTIAQTLADAKTAANIALTTARTSYTDGNYTAENLATLNGIKTTGDTAINAATTLAGVTSAQGTATVGMAGVAKDLADAKTAAHTDLDTALALHHSPDYTGYNWIILNAYHTNGDTAIDLATDLNAVSTAKTTAINGMAAVETITETEATAAAAVVTAEATPTQVNVTKAQDLVTALPGGAAKTALLGRIAAVQAIINATAALEAVNWTAANQAAVTQGVTNLAAARLLVDAAPAATQEAFDGRLNTVDASLAARQAELTATVAANAAIAALEAVNWTAANQAAVTQGVTNSAAARLLVAAAPAATQATFDGRLNTVDASLATRQAELTLAVTKVAAHTDLDTALALHHSSDYTGSNWIILNAYHTNGDTAIDVATDLNAVSTAKTTAINGMAAVETITETEATATAAVVTAETTPTQGNVNAAQTLVTALPNGAAKTALQDRITAVQAIIDATAAVVTAETTPTQGNVGAAQTLVTALPADVAPATTKTALQGRITAVQAIINATAAVVTAEGSKSSTDIATAQGLVTALPTGTAKTALQLRIDIINATAAVVTAEGSKSSTDIATAQGLVTALPTGTAKTNLQSRIDAVKTSNGLLIQGPNTIRIGTVGGARILSASFVVTSHNPSHSSNTDLYSLKAYNETTEVWITLAQNPANYSLRGDTLTVSYSYAGSQSYSVLEFYFENPDGCLAGVNSTITHTETYAADLTAYNAALGAVHEADYTTGSWTTYQLVVTGNGVTVENTQAQVNTATSNITAAQGSLISKLAAAKSAADVELAKVAAAQSAYITAGGEATDAVYTDVTAAETAVTNAKTSNVTADILSTTGTLTTKLGAVTTATTVLTDATAAVVTAETTPTQGNVAAAQTLVTALPAGAEKTALQSRIAAVQAIINATAAVVTAETTPTQGNVDAAQTLVTALPNGLAKTALQVRIDAVKAIINATAAVVTAEGSRQQADVTAAQTLVTALPVGEAKTTLQGRIDEIVTAPTIAITSDKTSLKKDETATITFTLSEASTNFVVGDVTPTGCALSAFTSNEAGTSYTAILTPFDNAYGTAVLNVEAGAFTDAAGHANTAATQFGITIDTLAPTVTAGVATRTSDTAATVKFTSNEAGKYYTAVVVKDATAPTIDTTGAGTDCTTAEATASVTLTAGDQDVYVVVKDAAGNVSIAVKIAVAPFEIATQVVLSPTAYSAVANGGVVFTLTLENAAGNPVTSGSYTTDMVRVTLTPGTISDQGTLNSGVQTVADNSGPCYIDVSLTNGTATFTYASPESLPSGGSGTISIIDTTNGNITPVGTATITDPS